MRPLRLACIALFGPLLAAPVVGCGSQAGPAGPRIDVDASHCESALQTLVTLAPATSSDALVMHAIAVGDDGTIYFDRWGVPLDLTGIYALGPGQSAPVRISAFEEVQRMWVRGSTLLVASYGRLYTMPTSGGTPMLVAQVPPAGQDDQVLPGVPALDSTGVYVPVNTRSTTTDEFDLYWLPLAGGDAKLVASSKDQAYSYGWGASLQIDADNVYLVASEGKGVGPLMTVPKAGGAFTMVLPKVYVGLHDTMALFGGDFYSNDIGANLTQYPADPGASPVVIDGLDGTRAGSTFLAADSRGIYTALLEQPSDPRMAFAAVPTGTEGTSLLACTPPASVTGHTFTVIDMALDATSVYALASDPGVGHYEVWRMAR